MNYRVGNLNELQLVPEEYDVVFASMSIHHVETLEALCTQICRTLRDGGYFICNEYIGPNRFQSESVRSADIMPVLRQYFQIGEYSPYGGSLLHFVLQNIVGNFQDGQEEDDAWLDMHTYFEQLLEEKAVIASDFALVIATPLK